ncbi:MAG: hypothetical protein QOJ73_2685 [Streptosporangiaceae bacterium]|nr:hypothetical protein [Streptosporangiaceae bacterium]
MIRSPAAVTSRASATLARDGATAAAASESGSWASTMAASLGTLGGAARL